MPTYSISAPDGKTYRIEGPPGATDEQVRAEVIRQNPHLAEQPEKRERTWMETAGEAVTNIPSSAKNMAMGFVDLLRNPGATISAVAPLLAPLGSSQNMVANARLASAMGQYAVNRYGSESALKESIATDPVGVAADLSLFLTGGGTAAAKLPQVTGRTAGAVSRAGERVAQVGRAIDPIQPIVAAAKAAPAFPGKALANALGFTTGAGGAAVGEAARAGMVGGQRAEAFTGQMRSSVPANAVVDEARKGLDALRQQRAAAYRTNMAGVTADKTILDFTDIDKAVNAVKNRGSFKGVNFRPEAAKTWEKIDELISTWKSQNPADFHTPEGIDKLKQGIGEIRDSLEYGSPARNAADEIYGAVRGEVAQQAPDYAKAMADYENASKLIGELQHSLSLKNTAQTDTTLRKLQSIFRNNANTNYGQRVELGRQLEAAGATDLFPMLAGQAMSSALPRALSGTGSGIASLGAGFLTPKALALIPFTMPRVIGEATYATGAAVRPGYKLAQALNRYGAELVRRNPNLGFAVDRAKRAAGKVDPYTARMLAAQLSQIQREQEQE